MKRIAFFRALVSLPVVIFLTSGLAGCRTVVVGDPPPGPVVRAPGPPPHAPAHGHRRKHARSGEPALRFDAELGVHVVIGHPGVYVHDGWYVRFDSGRWLASASLEGPWKTRRPTWVPPGLRAKHRASHGHGKSHGKKKRGRGAAKRAW